MDCSKPSEWYCAPPYKTSENVDAGGKATKDDDVARGASADAALTAPTTAPQAPVIDGRARLLRYVDSCPTKHDADGVWEAAKNTKT